MNCNLNESQIQAWLDGDEDHSAHAAECSDCQAQLALLQKVRTRLSAPPSPLGRDFAQRTAARVLRQSVVEDVVQRQRVERRAPWWKRVTDNPLVQIVQRERTRRLFRVPGLAAVALLYLVPGFFVLQGDGDVQWAYFGMLRIGLTCLVPLFLLSIEMTTLSGLVRGRCLEEMLQTGLEPKLMTDTLAANGLRALLPALLFSSVALLPLQPWLVASWLPVTAITFVAACYLCQAHLLVAGWPRLLSGLGAACVVAALGASAPYNLLALPVLVAVASWARTRSWQGLSLQQQGQTPLAPRTQPGKLQQWLAPRLPDLALLQRELSRRPVVSAGMFLTNVACLAFFVYLFGYSGDGLLWPFIMGLPAALVGFQLVSREKESGGYDVLMHSGLRFRDWWISGAWLATLQFAPMGLGLTGLAAYNMLGQSGPGAACMALGVACCLSVSLWAGTVIGSNAGLTTASPRQAAVRCMQELMLVSIASLLLLGASEPLVGQHSFLQGMLAYLGLTMDRFMTQADILPVTLALYFRARQLRERDRHPERSWNPWLLGLAPSLPVVLWLQLYLENESGLASWYGWLSVALSGVWAAWLAPRMALVDKPTPRQWALCSCTYVATVAGGLTCLVWLIGTNTDWKLLAGLGRLDWLQATFFAASWSVLVALLGERQGWKVQARYTRRDGSRRTAWFFSLAGLMVTLMVAQFASMISRNRSHADEFAGFVSAHDSQIAHRQLLKPLIKKILGSASTYYYGSYGPDYPMGKSDLTDPNLISFNNQFAVTIMRNQPDLLRTLVNTALSHPLEVDARQLSIVFAVCEMRALSALVLRDEDTAMECIQWMANLCQATSQKRHTEESLNMSSRVRLQALLALRSQTQSTQSLESLKSMLAKLPDQAADWKAGRDSQAASIYRTLVDSHDMYLGRSILNQTWMGRIFLKDQADEFLDDYLAGKTPVSHLGSMAQQELWRLNTTWSRLDENSRFLREVSNQVWELERYRVDHGSYPSTLRGQFLAYQSDGQSYRLKIWRQSLIFSTSRRDSFQIRR